MTTALGIALWLTAHAAPLARVERKATPTVIANVSVFHEDGSISGPHDVYLQDGRIASISEAGAAPQSGPDVVDGTDRLLLPGLIDLHVHLHSGPIVPGKLRFPSLKRNLQAFLHQGVTTVFDPGGQGEKVVKINRMEGPRLYAAGRPFAAPGGHPRSTIVTLFDTWLVRMATKHLAWEVDSPESVDAAFAQRPRLGFVKVMLDDIPAESPVLDASTLKHIAKRAASQGERVVAHVGHPDDVDRALDLPVDALMHVPYREALRDYQLGGLRRQEIEVVPTLAVWHATWRLLDRSLDVSPRDEAVMTRGEQRDFSRSEQAELPPALASWAEEVRTHHDDIFENVRRLHEAGVTVLVGSDSPNIGQAAGSSTHHELALLERAGMTPEEIWVAATWKNSRFLDPEAPFGAVKVDYEADLILAEGSELSTDIDIAEVWIDGRRVRRRQGD